MGLPDAQWKLSSINKNFEICPTYPSLLAVPASINDAFLSTAAACRSKRRLPVLTWRHAGNHASMCRSSQPLVGLSLPSSSNIENTVDDVVLLEHIHVASGRQAQQTPVIPRHKRRCPSEDLTRLRSADAVDLHAELECDARPMLAHMIPEKEQIQPGYVGIDGRRREKFVVIDARPELSARANQAARGMGFENTPQYKQVCQVVFMGVPNIHVIRKSWDSLQALCCTKGVNSAAFGMHVEGTRWLFHIHKILSSSLFVAHLLHNHGVSVLVHCSDGWDRTSQLCATAQLLVDPYYRTLRGFQALVHKDWVAFGHNFTRRSGLDQHGHTSTERAPIFVQWLDCVHQILRQFPSRFEFGEALLLFLAQHATSGWTGDFLYDCERERTEARVEERTISLFAVIEANKQRFLNPAYVSPSCSSAPPSSSFLTPVTSTTRLVLWEAYFLSWQSELYDLAWRLGKGDSLFREDGDSMSKVSLLHTARQELQATMARHPSATILRSLSDNDTREQEGEDDEDEDEEEQEENHDEENNEEDKEGMGGDRKQEGEGGKGGGKNGGVLHLHVLSDMPYEGQPASADEDPLYF